MKLFSGLAVGILMLTLSGFAPAEDKDDKATLIIGKWKITKTDGDAPVGTTIEFMKDGKLAAVAKIGDMDIKIDGTYKVEKDKLMTKITIAENTVEDTDTIKKLTEDTLELEDKDKKITVMKKEKKAE